MPENRRRQQRSKKRKQRIRQRLKRLKIEKQVIRARAILLHSAFPSQQEKFQFVGPQGVPVDLRSGYNVSSQSPRHSVVLHGVTP